MMQSSLWIVFFSVTVAFTHSKPVLLTFVVPNTAGSPDAGHRRSQDVVTIDPSTGNITKLNYRLPTANRLCAQIDQKRSLIYILNATDKLVKYSIRDGHVVDTYSINNTEVSTFFDGWDYDPDHNILYGTCLKPDFLTKYWTYTWCYASFNDTSRTGLLYRQDVVFAVRRQLGSGYCSNIHMNRDTLTTGEYWYATNHYIMVKNVKSKNGDPWKTLWSVEDEELNYDSVTFAAIITGKVNEYAIVIHLSAKKSNSFIVANLTADGQETVLAELPSSLSSQSFNAVPWAFDPESQIVYILMQSTDKTDYELVDTLVKVNLSLPPERAIETVSVPLQSMGYDPTKYTVFETYLIDM